MEIIFFSKVGNGSKGKEGSKRQTPIIVTVQSKDSISYS